MCSFSFSMQIYSGCENRCTAPLSAVWQLLAEKIQSISSMSSLKFHLSPLQKRWLMSSWCEEGGEFKKNFVFHLFWWWCEKMCSCSWMKLVLLDQAFLHMDPCGCCGSSDRWSSLVVRNIWCIMPTQSEDRWKILHFPPSAQGKSKRLWVAWQDMRGVHNHWSALTEAACFARHYLISSRLLWCHVSGHTSFPYHFT